jgi:hypothetical protein
MGTGTLVLWESTEPKNGCVTAFGQQYLYRIAPALCLVILGQLEAKPSSFHPHHRVEAWIEGRSSGEDFHSDDVLLELVSLAGECLLDDVSQEMLQA